MGCFSSLCKVCGQGVNSTSFQGELVEIFLLKNGKVIQHMSGEYDSYGRVFINDTQNPTATHELRESVQWNMEWSEVCNLEFNDNPGDGLAYIHTACWDGQLPTEQSLYDPDQGWNRLKEEHLPKDKDGSCLYLDLLERYEDEDLDEEDYYEEDYEELDEDED